MLPFGSPMQIGAGLLNVDQVFATTLMGGNNGTIYPLPFAPDFNWQKRINSSSSHSLQHKIDKELSSASTTGEINSSNGPDGLSKNIKQNPLANSVGWSFRRARKFFDIVTYTGDNSSERQITHGLGVKPGLIIIKRLDTSSQWSVYSIALGFSKVLQLNSQDSAASTTSYWINEPSDKTFTIGRVLDINELNGKFIAYLFAHDPSPTGIIQCGLYNATGGSGGLNNVTLGWEPQWLIVKHVGGIYNWQIADNKRGVNNSQNKLAIFPNADNAETSINGLQFTTTGFITSQNNDWNRVSNGGQYIYMAIRKGKT